MRFYRRLKPFKAISFDLDDTLYSNTPIMVATEAKMISYFATVLKNYQQSSVVCYDYSFWLPFRRQALSAIPALVHDVAALRLESYRLGFQALGLSLQLSITTAQKALAYFVECRSDFSVPTSSHHLLAQLKQKFPLIAISNGNVDTKAIGLTSYFEHIFHAGNGNLQKPCADMFINACKKLAIAPCELLHVGDCGRSDIVGGQQAGCQTAWLSCYDVGRPLSILPTIELTDVNQLHQLL